MNPHAYSRQHPRRRSSIWVTIVILAMLASSLAALANPAAAQPIETPTTGEIQAPPTDAPVDLPTQPVVAPPDEPTAVPT